MSRPRTAQDELVRRLIESGPTPSRDILRALGTSAATLSRLVHATEGKVVRIGNARAARYAVPREVRTFGSTWQVHRIDSAGRPHFAAMLRALHPRAWWYDSAEPAPEWIYGDFRYGLFPDLPWFLDDLRPQGFMGRAFARSHAEELGLNPDPRIWDADGVLTSLLLYGDDLPGDFVVGDAALERLQRATLSPPVAVSTNERTERYSTLAASALAGDIPGSSAGGEQPKFTTCVHDAGSYRHVIVKFSPPIGTPLGRRWADLLVCEHLSAETLREHGIDSVETTLIEGGNRLYLEISRFDRVGAHGRKGFVTLLPLETAYFAKLDNWQAAAERLQAAGWLNPEDADNLRLLWWFGRLIANTDLHFGNVGLELDHARPLRLAPAYDMLPMHYRPSPTGEVLTPEFVPPIPMPLQLSSWRSASRVAVAFWERVGKDTRVSAEFRKEAARIRQAILTVADRHSFWD